MTLVRSLCLAALLLSGTSLAAAAASATLRVHTGPTPIPGGNAQGARDITVVTEHYAVAFAVETPGPWGVARGGIIDVAEVRDGVIAPDRAALVDFMPNDWSGWPTTYQRVIIEKQTPQEVILRTERDWEGVALVTTWRLAAGEDTLHLRTQMHNRSEKHYPAILSGYVLWPEGGHLFAVPGSEGIKEGLVPDHGAHWSAAFDRDWLMGLHAPFADRIKRESRDRYVQHALASGETREFEAWLQVGTRGELAPLVARELEREQRPAGRLGGRVTTPDGTAVSAPAVIIEKQDGARWFPFTWALGEAGRYALTLPVGSYRAYATAEGFSNGQPLAIEIREGADAIADFADIDPPGELEIRVLASASGEPLDARIAIEHGARPLIPYFGRNTFFTELDPLGRSSLRIPPGDYRLRVSAAQGFRAAPAFLNARVAPGARQVLEAPVELLADPAAEGWYGGDMHHHSDVLDGFSPPEWVLRSQLAAGLDITLLSDHDAVVNNRELNRLSALRGKPFIAATEFSPSWAHFNAYPLDPEATIDIDVGRATVQQVFAEARRMGARIVQANHPYNNYGYFRSQRNNAIPGGYSADFDLVEVNGGDVTGSGESNGDKNNEEAVRHAWRLWNAGQKAYFSAGSDAHDVWKQPSGTARMYVKLDGPLDTDAFVAALKRGNAYASQGPLVFPGQPFGETLRQAAGAPLALDFELQAVNGLASVELIERGESRERRAFDDAPTARVPVRFTAAPRGNTWYSLVVRDATGRQAWTNPIWVETE